MIAGRACGNSIGRGLGLRGRHSRVVVVLAIRGSFALGRNKFARGLAEWLSDIGNCEIANLGSLAGRPRYGDIIDGRLVFHVLAISDTNGV